MEEKLQINIGDTLLMKKPHACKTGDKKMLVMKLGSDIKIKCAGCGHEMLVSRVKLEKNIKQIISSQNN